MRPSATPSVLSEPKPMADSADNTAPEEPPPAKKRRRGQNKHRPRPAMLATSAMLCSYFYSPDDDSTLTCHFGDKCKFMHDLQSFMNSKPPDIGENCYLFETYGKCSYGRACRFGAKHLTTDHKNMVNKDLYNPTRNESTINFLSKTLQEQLRKRTFEFSRSESYLTRTKQPGNNEEIDSTGGEELPSVEMSEPVEDVATKECVTSCTVSEDSDGTSSRMDAAKLRPAEKKKVLLYIQYFVCVCLCV